MMKRTEGTITKKKRKQMPLLFKIIVPMLILVLLQIVFIVAAFGLSGEFAAIKEISYNSISEKTENRRNYVENALNQKTALVYEMSNIVSGITDDILEEEHLTAADIKQDKNLNKRILYENARNLISLIRRDMVNEAFIILDSGTLYNEEGTDNLTGLYMRDTDVNENSMSDNGDIYMEIGSSEIAHELGLPLDYGWSLYMDMGKWESENYSFYYDALEAYKSNPNTPLYHLGKWSGFSDVTDSAQPSLKYALPLVTEDGNVYGVIGIGLLKKTVLQSIPFNDFFDEGACYIIAADLDADNIYDPILFSGHAYHRLVDENTELSRNHSEEYGLYDFTSNGLESIGSIQDMTLYNAGSPFRNQKWALISIVDKAQTLNMYVTMIRVFLISVVITLFAGALFAFVVSKNMSRPVIKMMGALEESRVNNSIVSFQSSGILEIDSLANSIVELQVNATEYASRVSKIITMSGSKIGVFMIDCRKGTVFVGESLVKLLNFSDSAQTGDITISFDEFCKHLSMIDKDNRLMSMDIFATANGVKKENMDELPDSESIEIQFESPDTGDVIWLQFGLTGDNNNIIGLVQDITNTVSEKKEIARVKDDEYTGKLIKANAALREAYAVAKQANSAKTDFLSRMSHDIRTPMNAIIGMTTIAQAHLDDRQKIEDCLNKIGVSSQYLLSLINEVLDMSKIESGKFVLAEEDINLRDMVNSVVEIIRPTVKAKKHQFDLHISELKHENVIGDNTHIQQAFVNILSNAVKYTPEGGHIEWEVSEKNISQKRVGCYEFVFRDNGIGMSEEFLKKLYAPFERASDVRVNKEQGTGLGMAITKNIIEMMDGDIQVESSVGKGTTFTVTIFLRFKETNAATQAEDRPTEKIVDVIQNNDFSGVHVLLVDDNELNREIACEILGMTNLVIDEAEDGQEAVDKFAQSPEGYYHMIFMDVQMPVMNGYDAASAIRKLSRADALSVPIVAMTADAFAEDVQAAKNAGMNEHIAKPLNFNKLMQILNQWLKSKD